MSQELTLADHRFQPVVQQKRKFDEQEVAILRASYGKSLDPIEFKVYVATASHLNLDPFSREIYALKYGTHPMTLITSIGGYRKMSARSGRYLGLTEGTMLCRTEQGQTVTVKHSEYDPDTHTEIISGTMGIRVMGYPEPVMATAVFKSYAKKVQGRLTENWQIMPDVMILKCAEAAAHRRAALFPDGAAAVYVEGEVQEYYDSPEVVETAKPIFPALEAPKPEPAKRTRATKAAPRQEDTPTETATSEDSDNAWDETPVGKKYREIEKFYSQQMSDPETGWNYATALILKHFGVEDVTQITDVEALRKFGSGELLKALQEEAFLPSTRMK
jgi:phage recombination protein Bet